MSEAALDSYGWRIAFLIGAACLPFGLWLRSGLPETVDLEAARTHLKQAARQTLRDGPRQLRASSFSA